MLTLYHIMKNVVINLAKIYQHKEFGITTVNKLYLFFLFLSIIFFKKIDDVFIHRMVKDDNENLIVNLPEC